MRGELGIASSGSCDVVAYIFFADPDPDETERLNINLYTEYEDLVIQDVAQENNIFVFHQSTVAFEAELHGWEDTLAAAKDRALAMATSEIERLREQLKETSSLDDAD